MSYTKLIENQPQDILNKLVEYANLCQSLRENQAELFRLKVEVERLGSRKIRWELENSELLEDVMNDKIQLIRNDEEI